MTATLDDRRLDDFEVPLPGSWTQIAFAEANHEAQHAVAAVLFDVTVCEVRIDRPDVGTLGHTVTEKHPEKWRRAVVAIAPVAFAGKAGSRPDLLATDSDVWHAAVDYFDSGRPLDEWPAFVAMVRELLSLPSSRRAITAVSGALLERGALRGDEVHSLIESEVTSSQPLRTVRA